MVKWKKSVSQIVGEIKSLLEGEFRQISVEGEVTNLSHSSAGHWYFGLADRDSLLNGALFRMDALRNPLVKGLKNGDQVVCSGSIGVYSRRGSFQLIAKTISKVGKGDLKEEFEKLKNKLAGEGLFDLDKKLSIPKLPRKVAVITALKGAALQDFINIYKRRSMWMELVVVPAVVQGDQSPKSLIKALSLVEKLNVKKTIDLVVLTRGGGSIEDLAAFNDEALARKISSLTIPIVSAVGHQVDFSISDFVSDLRCETPSAAAEVITESQVRLQEELANHYKFLLSEMKFIIQNQKESLDNCHPRQILEIIWNNLRRYEKRLNRLDITNRIYELTNIHEMNLALDDAFSTMKEKMRIKINHYDRTLIKYDNLLMAMNPRNVLERGFTYIENKNSEIISSLKDFKQLGKDELLTIHFHDGKGQAQKDS